MTDGMTRGGTLATDSGNRATGSARIARSAPTTSPAGTAAGTAAEALTKGMALNGADINQPVEYAIDGDVTVSTSGVATAYWLSDTPGKLVPAGDAAIDSGKFVVPFGVGSASNKIVIGINAAGQALA